MSVWRTRIAVVPVACLLLPPLAVADMAMLAGYWTAPGQGKDCAALVHVLEPDGVLTILPFGLVSGEGEILRGRWRAEGDGVTLSFAGGIRISWTGVAADTDHLAYTQDGVSIELDRCADQAAARIGIGLTRLPPVPQRP